MVPVNTPQIPPKIESYAVDPYSYYSGMQTNPTNPPTNIRAVPNLFPPSMNNNMNLPANY